MWARKGMAGRDRGGGRRSCSGSARRATAAGAAAILADLRATRLQPPLSDGQRASIVAAAILPVPLGWARLTATDASWQADSLRCPSALRRPFAPPTHRLRPPPLRLVSAAAAPAAAVPHPPTAANVSVRGHVRGDAGQPGWKEIRQRCADKDDELRTADGDSALNGRRRARSAHPSAVSSTHALLLACSRVRAD